MKREIEMQGTIKAVKGNGARGSIPEVLAQRSREKPDRPARDLSRILCPKG